MCWHVAEVRVESALPHELPRVGVESDDAFLCGVAAAYGGLQVDAIPEDNGT
jgi:hypothetical protein